MKSLHSSLATYGIVGVVCFAGAFLLTAQWLNTPRRGPVDWANALPARPPIDGSQEEEVLVLLLSASCGASRDHRLPLAWDAILEAERADAIMGGRALRVIGAAIANPVKAGLTILETFGSFDEITSGLGWEAIGGIQFLFGDLVGPPAVPQVIQFRRTITNRSAGGPIIHDVRMIRRWVGVEGIVGLAERRRLLRNGT
jgi:hypothetical protein